ncbi:brachyurin-like [Zophobas morio]|uniref:brachyurin-like n=1 Tax=Zophobas morio TaxID=2755281 RepID=UPI003083527A
MHLRPVLILVLVLSLTEIHNAEATPTNKRISSRIIGGTNAYAGQFKFAAAITVHTETSRFFCSGALITNQWILTGGQCVNGATLFTIQLGSNTLNGDDSNRVTVATSEYSLHPDFNPATLENDIGLIKLRIPVELTDYVDTIDYLPTVPVQVATSLLSLGWGQISDDDPELANHLNWVQVTSLSNNECKQSYGSQITDNMVCVSGNYNEGTCIGDSGGPLVHVVSRGQMVHTGVSSFISGNGCQSTDPSGYTRTYPYLNWIKNITLI